MGPDDCDYEPIDFTAQDVYLVNDDVPVALKFALPVKYPVDKNIHLVDMDWSSNFDSVVASTKNVAESVKTLSTPIKTMSIEFTMTGDFAVSLFTGDSTSSHDNRTRAAKLRTMIPDAGVLLDAPCGCKTRKTVWMMVQHLNDLHNPNDYTVEHWSRERIADWLETLDLDLRVQDAPKDQEISSRSAPYFPPLESSKAWATALSPGMWVVHASDPVSKSPFRGHILSHDFGLDTYRVKWEDGVVSWHSSSELTQTPSPDIIADLMTPLQEETAT